jgi:hypothetical protein
MDTCSILDVLLPRIVGAGGLDDGVNLAAIEVSVAYQIWIDSVTSFVHYIKASLRLCRTL